MLNNILWKSKKRWQIISAALGAFIGLLLLLSALQFYVDVTALMGGGNNEGEHYVQINKRVSFLNSLGLKSTFSEEEIAKIDSLEFVKGLSLFTSNQYKVGISLSQFYTEAFFEAVEDDFLDVQEPEFRWQRGQNQVPVIVSRDYLALYNFGFAPSQGLPQLTPNTIGMANLDITIRGNGLRKTFTGKVVGFSDRINSILVPQSFMDWANDNFGNGKSQGSSRLIMSVENPLAQELADFIKENDYEISTGRIIGGQFQVLLNIVLGVIAIIGVILLMLSIFIFILNFQLIISESSNDIRLLLQLGYKTKQISQVLTKNITILYAIIIVTTLVVLFVARQLFIPWLDGQGFELEGGLHWIIYLVTVLFSIAFLAINFDNIRRNVRRLF